MKRFRYGFTSMNATLVPVDSFQAESLSSLGIKRRDPMYITMLSCLDVEAFPTADDIRRHCDSLGTPDEQAAKVQWLYEGLSPEEVAAVFKQRRSGDRSTTHFARPRL